VANWVYEDDDPRHLSAMQALKELDLRENQITDTGLKHLAKPTELRKLDLTGNNIRGPGVPGLSGLLKLETLVFDLNPELDDSALEPLRALPRLCYVSVSESKITIDALRRSRKRRPNVEPSFHAPSACDLTMNDRSPWMMSGGFAKVRSVTRQTTTWQSVIAS